MKKVFDIRLWSVLLLVAGCVTVNVYFPAAAAEQAADKIIKQVYGADSKPAAPVSKPAPDDQPQSSIGTPSNGATALLNFLIPAAYAQQPNLDISTPAVTGLERSMAARHRQLTPYYNSGAVGMDNNGLISVRAPSKISIRDRNRVNQLVAAENRDRNALYRQIAKANGHPEWERDIRNTFARRWVANAPHGWYFQDSTGGWKRK